jgi:hypothetical protein
MADYLSKREVLTRTLDFLSRNRLALLFLVLIGSQLLTWRAVVTVEDQVDNVRRAVTQYSCGSKGDSPCRVVIVDR